MVFVWFPRKQILGFVSFFKRNWKIDSIKQLSVVRLFSQIFSASKQNFSMPISFSVLWINFCWVCDSELVCDWHSWTGSFQIVPRWTSIMHTTWSLMGGKAKRTRRWALRPERHTGSNLLRLLTWTGHASWPSRTSHPQQLNQSHGNCFHHHHHHLFHTPKLPSPADTFLRYMNFLKFGILNWYVESINVWKNLGYVLRNHIWSLYLCACDMYAVCLCFFLNNVLSVLIVLIWFDRVLRGHWMLLI